MSLSDRSGKRGFDKLNLTASNNKVRATSVNLEITVGESCCNGLSDFTQRGNI